MANLSDDQVRVFVKCIVDNGGDRISDLCREFRITTTIGCYALLRYERLMAKERDPVAISAKEQKQRDKEVRETVRRIERENKQYRK